jgi:predicted glycosyltransferase
MYQELKLRGHDVLFVAKDKECVIDLLDAYDLPYIIIGKTSVNLLKKAVYILIKDIRLHRIARSFKPDIFISRVSPNSSHVSMILKKPHICFADTETSKGYDWIATPGVDIFLTADSYNRNHGIRQIKYPGYHELAYLHPNRFNPNKNIFKILGLKEGEKYAIVRFVSWAAHHDIGQKGITRGNKILLVKELNKYAKVLISSECNLPDELMPYKINLKPEDMHDILNYAHLFIGESGTMASECAVLGTPAVFINNNNYGCIDNQASYGLLYQFRETEKDQLNAIEKAVELAREENKGIYLERKDRMLKDKIDVTAFMVWFVENYPESEKEMKKGDFDFDRF